jgi:hypothetical protein
MKYHLLILILAPLFGCSSRADIYRYSGAWYSVDSEGVVLQILESKMRYILKGNGFEEHGHIEYEDDTLVMVRQNTKGANEGLKLSIECKLVESDIMLVGFWVFKR